jgi:hypothetical protein
MQSSKRKQAARVDQIRVTRVLCVGHARCGSVEGFDQLSHVRDAVHRLCVTVKYFPWNLTQSASMIKRQLHPS